MRKLKQQIIERQGMANIDLNIYKTIKSSMILNIHSNLKLNLILCMKILY